MRAAKMKERPSFPLMRQTDVQNMYHMQMPLWLFYDPRYSEMSLDAKVTYTFLLNRYKLSRKNGWVNERGEVFVIFPRKALAKELRICEQRVTAAFRKLVELKLVWEKRCGRGDANQIYLAVVKPEADPEYTCAPFLDVDDEDCGSRTAESAGLGEIGEPQEPQDRRFQNPQNGALRTAEDAAAEPQRPMPNKNDRRENDGSYIDVSLSVAPGDRDRPADDDEELDMILENCELYAFDPEVARVFENAIERLFYSDSFRIGNATLPQKRVRSKLRLLDGMILRTAEQKLHANLERDVKNSTAYTMVTIFNCIAENESDILVDPYINSLGALPGRR